MYHKWQSYEVWSLSYRARRREFFIILDHFLSFYLPNKPKNQNFEKMKKTPGDIMILHKCTINDNHMMYGSWDMKCDRQNFLSFWTIFLPFTPLTTQKIKIKKKNEKNAWRYHHLFMCTKNYDQMMYGSWDIVHDGWTDGQIGRPTNRWTDRQTDRRKKWHIEVGVPAKNMRKNMKFGL